MFTSTPILLIRWLREAQRQEKTAHWGKRLPNACFRIGGGSTDAPPPIRIQPFP